MKVLKITGKFDSGAQNVFLDITMELPLGMSSKQVNKKKNNQISERITLDMDFNINEKRDQFVQNLLKRIWCGVPILYGGG